MVPPVDGNSPTQPQNELGVTPKWEGLEKAAYAARQEITHFSRDFVLMGRK